MFFNDYTFAWFKNYHTQFFGEESESEEEEGEIGILLPSPRPLTELPEAEIRIDENGVPVIENPVWGTVIQDGVKLQTALNAEKIVLKDPPPIQVYNNKQVYYPGEEDYYTPVVPTQIPGVPIPGNLTEPIRELDNTYFNPYPIEPDMTGALTEVIPVFGGVTLSNGVVIPEEPQIVNVEPNEPEAIPNTETVAILEAEAEQDYVIVDEEAQDEIEPDMTEEIEIANTGEVPVVEEAPPVQEMEEDNVHEAIDTPAPVPGRKRIVSTANLDEDDLFENDLSMPSWVDDSSIDELLKEEIILEPLTLEDKIKNIEYAVEQMIKNYNLDGYTFLLKHRPRKKKNKKKDPKKPKALEDVIKKKLERTFDVCYDRIIKMNAYVFGTRKHALFGTLVDWIPTDKRVLVELPDLEKARKGIDVVMPDWLPEEMTYVPPVANMAITGLTYFQALGLYSEAPGKYKVNTSNMTTWLWTHNENDFGIDTTLLQLTTMPWGKSILFRLAEKPEHENGVVRSIPENMLWIPIFDGRTGDVLCGCMVFWPGMIIEDDTDSWMLQNRIGMQIMTSWLATRKWQGNSSIITFPTLFTLNHPFYTTRYLMYFCGWGKHLYSPKEQSPTTNKNWKEFVYSCNSNPVTQYIYTTVNKEFLTDENTAWTAQQHWSNLYYDTLACYVDNSWSVTRFSDVRLQNGSIKEAIRIAEIDTSELWDLNFVKFNDIDLNVIYRTYAKISRLLGHIKTDLVDAAIYVYRVKYLKTRIAKSDNSKFREMTKDYEAQFAQDAYDLLTAGDEEDVAILNDILLQLPHQNKNTFSTVGEDQV